MPTIIDVRDGIPIEIEVGEDPAPDLADLIAAKVAAINAERDRRLEIGAVVGELRVAVGDGDRADISGMATCANTVLITAATPSPVAWPESYALGWITKENIRVPLPTAVDGLGFALIVGTFYGETVQHARDLKDEALAAENAEGLDAIDPLAGWPE